jgi:hypothetical protein
MRSEAPLNSQDPWQMPPIELDIELIETSQRLMSKSEALYSNTADQSNIDAAAQTPDPQMAALEMRNQYLFTRNIELVAKIATLEAANLSLQEQISALRQSQRSVSPWYLRWLRP